MGAVIDFEERVGYGHAHWVTLFVFNLEVLKEWQEVNAAILATGGAITNPDKLSAKVYKRVRSRYTGFLKEGT